MHTMVWIVEIKSVLILVADHDWHELSVATVDTRLLWKDERLILLALLPTEFHEKAQSV